MTSNIQRERAAGRQPPPISPEQRNLRRAGRPCVPLIPVPEDGLGPAMLALSPTMRAFVTAKVQLGASNAEAVRLSGYSTRSPAAVHVVANRLAHDERIQAALLE